MKSLIGSAKMYPYSRFLIVFLLWGPKVKCIWNLAAESQQAPKRINGTKTVPLGHQMIVRKTVPFGARFPKGTFQKGTVFPYIFYTKTVPEEHKHSAPGHHFQPFFVAKWCPWGTKMVLILLDEHRSGNCFWCTVLAHFFHWVRGIYLLRGTLLNEPNSTKMYKLLVEQWVNIKIK